VLGFDSLTPYQDGTSPYFGAIVGRVANRIAGATFQLGGKRYSVTPNERGNCLHGGARGFDKRWWKAEPLQTPEGEALRLTYTSLNGALAAASIPLRLMVRISRGSYGGDGQARKGFPAT
jgi:aldose 1-epimerase